MQVAQVIGGAGTGKTTRLLGIMEQIIHTGRYGLSDIGFVSFTRVARQTAAERAAVAFGEEVEDLTQYGWFKTLHAICFKQLRADGKALLADRKESREWIAEAVGEPVSGSGDAVTGEDGAVSASDGGYTGRTDGDRALAIWGAARNRMVPFKELWEFADHCDEKTPSLARCRVIVEEYERHKRLDGRYDFTDLVGRFAGVQFGFEGHERCEPMGEVPRIPVLFFDECQDASALLHLVELRLAEQATWVYIVGDPFQAIYGFSGSDPGHFMRGWPVQKTDILQQTYRCPAPIVELGEKILGRCSDYFDRGIKPAQHGGSVDHHLYPQSSWTDELDPRGSWLILARTRHLANQITRRLAVKGLPWRPVSGHGGWDAPVRNKGLRALWDLQHAEPIDATAWREVVKLLPAKDSQKRELLVRGTKTQWAKREGGWDEQRDVMNLEAWGATELLEDMIAQGRWAELVEGNAAEWVTAAKRYKDVDAVCLPGIRVGTIHSAKGDEADNVALYTTATHQVHLSRDSQTGSDEELRLSYVAATRARKRLLVCSDVDPEFTISGFEKEKRLNQGKWATLGSKRYARLKTKTGETISKKPG